MKKLISFVLVFTMLFVVAAPIASAAGFGEQTPIIYIRGNGETIYNADGEGIAVNFENMEAIGGDEPITTDKIIETCANILLPFLTEGLLMDKWDNYGKALYDELSPLFAEGTLDGNGNPRFGTAVSPSRLASSEADSHVNYGADGQFDIYDYSFVYDWRLSPYDHVDRLHKYVTDVMAATGAQQVSIVGRCFGGSLLTAYLEKYGELGHVKNAVFSEVISNGSTIITKAFSGKIEFSNDGVQRYAKQMDRCGELGQGIGFDMSELADSIVTRTLDLFNQTEILGSITGSIESLYTRLYKALIPALCLATGMATQANYWTSVYEEDFDEALALMFGEEGSEARTEYAGLIEKIEYYREHVTSKLPELYKTFEEDYGIHIGVIAKYGYINAPFTEDADELSDALASLEDASLGATCARVGGTLSEDYIADRIENGFGAYISADKQVDTSTCLFPETTWIIKNAHHSFFELSDVIATAFCRGTNVTLDTVGAQDRFNVFYEENLTWEPMTEENCADFDFISLPEENPTEQSKLVAFFAWIITIFDFILKLFKGELAF